MAPTRDSMTEQVLRKMRDSVDNPKFRTISAQQRALSGDSAARGPIWVSRVTFPCPAEPDALQVLLKAIQDLGSGDESFTTPILAPVRGEWVGHRQNVTNNTAEPEVSESEKFTALMSEVQSTTTMLFVHGGAYYWGAPSKFRDITGTLSKLTGGRCFSVAYRLAPQNPFPAAILDVLVAYLSLLYPPSSTFHAPTPASSIVLVGDSSGAGICLAVLQVLLHLRHHSKVDPKIRFHDMEVSLPLPAGFAGLSTSADQTHSQRSWTANAMHDVLPNEPPPIRASQPPCDIWPSNPPRGDLYCDLSTLCHPLVSPTAVVDWAGSPPMRFGCGEEMLADEGAIIARQAARQDTCVIWEQFEGMPHSFVGYLGWLPQTKQCFEHWAEFCLQCVQNPAAMVTRGFFAGSQGSRSRAVDVRNMNVPTVEEARQIMAREAQKRRVQFQTQSRLKARI